jgi:hypothetical protein
VKSIASIASAAALLLVAGSTFSADFSFKPFKRQHPYTTSGCCWAEFEAAQVGDFNGDGRQDVAAIVRDDGKYALWVYRNRGGALPAVPTKYLPPPENDAYGYERTFRTGIAVADFNEDGVDDVAVGTSTGIDAFVSNGAGGFVQFPTDQSAWRDFTKIRAGDFNHDGHYDLIGLGRNNTDTLMFIFLGDGRGKFPTVRDLGVEIETQVRLADGWKATSLKDFRGLDVGNDGLIDLVLGYEVSTWGSTTGAEPTWKGKLRIGRNDGSGTFQPTKDYPVDYNFEDFTVGDFNSDGRQDIAFPTFAAWQQDAQGVFSESYQLPIYPTPQVGLTAGDLDGDGADDAMTQHYGWWTYGYYLQRRRKLTGEWGAEFLLPGGNMYPDGLAIGDFFGSACNDAAIANSYEGLVFLEGQDCYPRAQHEVVVPKGLDANGNGTSDLVVRNLAKHSFVTWYLSGIVRIASSAAPIGDAYRLAATGDFNGDGRGDLLWTSAARDLLVSFSTGTGYRQETIPLTYATGWKVVGAADVSGDRKGDILLRNEARGLFVVWMMDGSQRVAYRSHALAESYRFAGSGDFDRDGRHDLVWTSALRDVVISRSTGWGNFSDQSIGLNYNALYDLAGVADVNGDGMADLLLRANSLGKLVVWFMSGTTRTAYSSSTVGGNYRLVGLGDYNGDHRGDLVWVNDAKQILFSLSTGTKFTTFLGRDRIRGFVMDAR